MSAILSADDLNDFISPGVACIKPVETIPKQEDLNPYEVTTEDKIQVPNPVPASISLTDCLACSGCVTSAEAVLISLQSHLEVLNILDSYTSINPDSGPTKNDKAAQTEARLFVASVSPQVRASLAATYGTSEEKAGYLIEQFLSGPQGLRNGGKYNNGFTFVLDTNRLREACLVLGADEVENALKEKSLPQPVITSACPGWICYAEKTHPHVLPHLSKLKSPQALIGTMLKSVLSKALGIKPAQIWHLAIMPCFDKKLEASREELTDQWRRQEGSMDTDEAVVRDVDCVITSRELLSLAEARDIKLSTLSQTRLSQAEKVHFPDLRISRFLFPKPRRRSAQAQHAGTSGGYLYHILKTQQQSHPGSTISIQRGRNADVIEYFLLSPTHQTLFKGARYYGFRNIQNLVRKLRPVRHSRLPGAARHATMREGGSADYAYVEVMACPGGCTNGGGQIKVEDVKNILPETRGEEVEKVNVQSQKEWLKRVDEAYYSADSDEEEEADNDPEYDDNVVNGINVQSVHEILDYWVRFVDIPLQKLAYTSFRKVESDVGKNRNIDDSARIAAIAGMSGGGW